VGVDWDIYSMVDSPKKRRNRGGSAGTEVGFVKKGLQDGDESGGVLYISSKVKSRGTERKQGH